MLLSDLMFDSVCCWMLVWLCYVLCVLVVRIIVLMNVFDVLFFCLKLVECGSEFCEFYCIFVINLLFLLI